MKLAVLALFLSVAFAGQPLPERLRVPWLIRNGQPLPERLRNPQPITPLWERFGWRPRGAEKATCGKTTLGNTKDIEHHIVGGKKATSGQHPWQISLQRSSHSCGGSIINERTIVTAAHCVDGTSPSQVSIRYNTLRHAAGDKISIQKIVVHPQYDSSLIDNDIAILQLKTPLELGQSNADTVCLPKQGDDLESGDVQVSGWGTTKEGGDLPRDLMTVRVPAVTRKACRDAYGQNDITDNMICAAEEEGGKDSCQGDSGGPLVTVKDGVATLRGVVSWGYGCARKGYPGVYTRVGKYVEWINKNTI